MKLKNLMKGGRELLRINFLLISFLCLLFVQAQNIPTSVFDKFPFINQNADTVTNAELLNSFFNKLQVLKTGTDALKVNILHVGDSHIQGDFLTREVRLNFQRNFGNGGRGLVFPYRLANSYEPKDIHSSSSNLWVNGKVLGAKKMIEPGLSGFSVACNDDFISFDMSTYNHDSLDYSFSKIRFIKPDNSFEYDCVIHDTANQLKYKVGSISKNMAVVQLDLPVNAVRFESVKSNLDQNKLTVNGVILENNNAGILYHVVGVNGAHYVDFNRCPLFFQQTPLVQPDIIILSLGTNEGVSPRITKQEVLIAIENMLINLRNYNPNVPIVLITPFDNYYRKKMYNRYLGIVRTAIVEAAKLNSLPYIDAYKITGGYGSASKWRKYGLLRPDGIHYMEEGYKLQGKIIYQAFINSYSKYAAN